MLGTALDEIPINTILDSVLVLIVTHCANLMSTYPSSNPTLSTFLAHDVGTFQFTRDTFSIRLKLLVANLTGYQIVNRIVQIVYMI